MVLSVRAQNGRCKSGWVGGIKISAVSPGAQYCGNKWDSTVAEQDVWGRLGPKWEGRVTWSLIIRRTSRVLAGAVEFYLCVEVPGLMPT